MSSIKLPKISLVTTCKDQLPLLQDTLGSVLGQGYPALEYIVIDRGSTDGTPAYLGDLDREEITLYQEPGLSAVEAMEKGFAATTGDVMGWLEPGDRQFHLALFKVALIFLNDWKINWVTGRQAQWQTGGDYTDQDFHCWNIRSLVGAFQQPNKTFPQAATFWRSVLYKHAGSSFGPGDPEAAALNLWLRFYEHVDMHSADALIGGVGGDLTRSAAEMTASRTVIQHDQHLINKANRRSSSPKSLRCIVNAPDFMRLVRETRPGYRKVDGVSVYDDPQRQRKSPPLLICYGLPKSASSFIWKMACSIADGEARQKVISKLLPEQISSRFMMPLNERCLAILELLPPDVTYVLKTHGGVSATVQTLVAAGLAKAVVSVRDPYDLVQSVMDVGVSERARPVEKQRPAFASIHTFEDALNYVLRFLDSCRGWLAFAQQNNFPVIHFERVKNEPETIATEISNLLLMPEDPTAIVEPFLRNKAKAIPEFNVGISGRGRKLFEGYHNPAVTDYLDEFNQLISKYEHGLSGQ